MKRSKFSEQQIAFILRQVEEGVAVEEVCRKAGISVQTYYPKSGSWLLIFVWASSDSQGHEQAK